jgi:hypothetical protein
MANRLYAVSFLLLVAKKDAASILLAVLAVVMVNFQNPGYFNKYIYLT